MSEVIYDTMLASGARVSLRKGDLTEEAVDAIVNAANEHLQHGGGVAGAISRKGGPSIQRESNQVGIVETGTAAMTGAGDLPSRFVIHAVGPIWSQHDEFEADSLLASAVECSLDLADAKSLVSIAFPAISSGIYGFPKDRCAEIMLRAAVSWLDDAPSSSIRDVRFVVIDEATFDAFDTAWRAEFAASYN
ncbi:MAG TPA: macro domain-containing protein [Armatimonadota bacterium]|jgi:O-acetyl-ADP-ribose deacetylase (regulator of RNase III)